ncbi:hypothetical protein AC579_6126 [Pseudocercospora musae]|uniref:Uncharacterized protein n=1 Tax=Pseudocercospora musae TaxID=113226 RepID=A0A139IM81_9PEZI|nr:hypothetical protein AC579_6126 [Pseudocercospora musae]
MHGTYNQINNISNMLPANSPSFCRMARWRPATNPSGPDAKILASSSNPKDGRDSDDPFGIKALEKAGIIVKEARSTESRPDSAISFGSTRPSNKTSTLGELQTTSSSSSFTSHSPSHSTGKSSKFKELFDYNNNTPIDMSSMPSLDECWEQDQKAYNLFKRQHSASFSREEHYRASQAFETTFCEPQQQPKVTSVSEASHDSLLLLQPPSPPFLTPPGQKIRTFTPPRVVSTPLDVVTEMARGPLKGWRKILLGKKGKKGKKNT